MQNLNTQTLDNLHWRTTINSFRLTTVKNAMFICTFVPVLSYSCLQIDKARIKNKLLLTSSFSA